jgi:hypothetical protein
MAQLTFPVTKAGLAVPVWIGLSGDVTVARLAAGQPLVLPVQGRGLLDTGTDVTAVAPWILQQLAIPATSKTSTRTVGGQVKVNVYKVSLGITDSGQAVRSWLTQPDLLVTDLPTVLPDVDVLVGLDVLLECKLTLEGPARQFTLEF